ncbi:MAG: phosphate acyltransferase, partial [Candidatus Cloacimonetes bacterium]|nr:phosphate acyltransferase [Candidatus Cloacimonadota bacterium]
MEIRKLDEMFEVLKTRDKKRLVAAWAIDAHSIMAVYEAVKMNIVQGILVGDENIIKAVCAEHEIDPANFTIVHIDNDIAAAAKAVDLINAGEGDFLMKGLLSTDRYMRAI